LIFAGSTPIGALFTGLLADLLGTAPMILIEGLLCLTGVGAGNYYVRKKVARTKVKQLDQEPCEGP
jgi:F0F1-type ATP synthase assembly protein I